jgi:hypothetical protein
VWSLAFFINTRLILHDSFHMSGDAGETVPAKGTYHFIPAPVDLAAGKGGEDIVNRLNNF